MKLNLKKKLIYSFLGIGLLPLFVSSLVSYKMMSKEITHDAYEISKVNLGAKKYAIESYLNSEIKSVQDYASAPATLKALNDFSEQFEKIENAEKNKQLFLSQVPDLWSGVKDYYGTTLANAYKEKSSGQVLDIDSVLKTLDVATVYFQSQYIVNNEHPLGAKDLLMRGKQSDKYNELHKYYHPSFRDYLVRHSLYDVFIVNKHGRVVYSVFKETDFATSLESGPWAQSGLAEAFRQTKDTKAIEVFISDYAPYAPSYEAPASFVASPIFDNGDYVGSFIVQLPLDKITSVLADRTGLGETGETLLFGADGKLRADTFRNKSTHTVAAFFNKDNKLSILSDAVKKSLNNESGIAENISYDGEPTLAAYAPISIANLKWGLVVELPKKEVFATLADMQYLFIAIILTGLFLISIFAYWFGNSLSQKINHVTGQLNLTAEQVTRSSINSASSATQLSEATTEQAASLQETMASIEEISAMVAQNAESAEKVLNTVSENKKITSDGEKNVNEMLTSISDIKSTNEQILSQMENSNKELHNIVSIISNIGEKTKVINDIVFQTKLLSFNASVEAARAGEHGKGFAVVAEEVGNLAQMSGSAAQQITDMLSDSIKKVNEIVENTRSRVDSLVEVGKDKIAMGQSTAQKCKESLLKISESAQTVSDMVTEITHASKEQSQGVQEINKAISQLDQVTQQNSAVAQQSSSQAQELELQSQKLKEAVTELVSIVDSHQQQKAFEFSNVKPFKAKSKAQLKENGLKFAVGENKAPNYKNFK